MLPLGKLKFRPLSSPLFTSQTSDLLMRKILILAVSAAALMISACNTVEGVGKDVSAAGRAVSNTAKDAK